MKEDEVHMTFVKIPYPCCPKEKVVAYPTAHGCSSIKCPNCGKYAVFDYDNLTARPGKVCRGAGKRPPANEQTARTTRAALGS